MPRIRVLVVDDAAVMRRMISEVLGKDPDLEIVGTASNGKIALQRIVDLKPDVLTMDMDMPEMDGISTVRELRKTHPRLPVIMFSALTLKGAAATLDALSVGATDYVTKPSNMGSSSDGLARLEADLIPKIKVHCSNLLPASGLSTVALKPTGRSPPPARTRLSPAVAPDVLCIGSSTGGPEALNTLFTGLTTLLPVPCVIVQHMPPLFTKMLAERLGRISPNRIYEGEQGQAVEAGAVYIAPGGRHMEVRKEAGAVKLAIHEGPPENSCRPSVDVLLRSVGSAYGAATLSVILTGMGQDGLRGCEALRERGGQILAQDQATSVVWGMPGYVAQTGLADKVLPLPQIAGEILLRLRRSGPPAFSRPA